MTNSSFIEIVLCNKIYLNEEFVWKATNCLLFILQWTPDRYRYIIKFCIFSSIFQLKCYATIIFWISFIGESWINLQSSILNRCSNEQMLKFHSIPNWLFTLFNYLFLEFCEWLSFPADGIDLNLKIFPNSWFDRLMLRIPYLDVLNILHILWFTMLTNFQRRTKQSHKKMNEKRQNKLNLMKNNNKKINMKGKSRFDKNAQHKTYFRLFYLEVYKTIIMKVGHVKL